MPTNAPNSTQQIQNVISSWSRLVDLVQFAVNRHGFGDSNGGFGVVYPSDVDEYQREVEHEYIAENHVQIYGYWGLPNGYEFCVHECVYLGILSQALQSSCFLAESQQINDLNNQLFPRGA
jgi:hypothetical protein